jgi:6-phospho-3-hexuloisomerase
MKDNYYDQILDELYSTLSELDDEPIDQLVDAIVGAKRIFLAGTGRSGLMLKCFAMRLMHLDLEAHVVGETTTPGISDNDLLIVGSGSGETGSISLFARTAKEQKAKLGLITVFPDSTIARLADIKVFIRIPASKDNLNNGFASIQYGGTLFEQSLMLVLDGMILRLMDRLNVSPSLLKLKHANLE